jgi:cytochrome c oxidase assembly factor CtaG
MTVMQDQMLAGTIMWIPGSMMYLLAALILVARLVREEEEKQALPANRPDRSQPTHGQRYEERNPASSASESRV